MGVAAALGPPAAAACASARGRRGCGHASPPLPSLLLRCPSRSGSRCETGRGCRHHPPTAAAAMSPPLLGGAAAAAVPMATTTRDRHVPPFTAAVGCRLAPPFPRRTPENKSINTYKDDEKIKKGKRNINDQLIESIEDSRFYIIVFSRNYASSSWCLDELVKIMECQKTTEHTAYPVFYDVEPTEVRKQNRAVGKAFAENEKKDDAGKWREALKEAADLPGWELKNTANGHEAKFIQKIVQEISLELRSFNFSVDEKLVGMETRIKDVVSSFEVGCDDVRMIGIKGMGGGGKTTLARAVFDQIAFQFEGRSFVENVREVSKSPLFGLKSLQKQVLSDVLNDQGITVSGVFDGKNMMRKVMSGRKVFVVLDDVDHREQLEALAGELNWFKPGSRIIITTRDEQVLIAHGVKLIHGISLLTDEESICLFNGYAFGRQVPIQRYEKLSRRVVHYAAGLPLTVKVLGSLLCGKNELEWEDAIERLKTIPLKETLEVLELSYISLEEDYKEMFLDIACYLGNHLKGSLIQALESCGFHARYGLRVLEQKSLITIPISDEADVRLIMHDHIIEMGKNIVRRFHPDDPKRHSRLWNNEEIEDILANNLGTETTRCVIYVLCPLTPEIVMKGLGNNMKKLIYLFVCSKSDDDQFQSDWKFDEVSQYFPNSLRYLNWLGYPFRYLPKTFQANNLVTLALQNSKIVQLWEGPERKVLNKLRFLHLDNSKVQTFNLGMTPNLEELTLSGCHDLVQLLLPLQCLKLTTLVLCQCHDSKLRTLELGRTPELKVLTLEGCHDLVEIHMPFGCPKLTGLNVSHSKLRTFDFRLTPNLEVIYLQNCYHLVELHAPVGCLKKLGVFVMSSCFSFKRFLYLNSLEFGSSSELILDMESLGICPLHPNNNLPKFQFTCKYFDLAPSRIENLEKLISAGHCACTDLESFFRTICGLQGLTKLTLKGSIPELPKELDQLERLEEISLSYAKNKQLPDSICMLKHLKSLTLRSCCLLEKLPKDLDRLECLEMLLLLDCIFLRDIPNNICKVKRLRFFNLYGCILVEKVPEELGCLESLKVLVIEGTAISHLPQSIFLSDSRLIVGSRSLLQSYASTHEIQTTECGRFYYIELGITQVPRAEVSSTILQGMIL